MARRLHGRAGAGKLLAATLAALLGCSSPGQTENEAQNGATGDAPGPDTGSGWLRGNINARLDLVAKHLRGFDVAMAEAGYRYTELYWAARDRNWGYAEYQLGKIETAVANGIERRPARAESARMLEPSVQNVRAAIERRDGLALDAAIDALTNTCNACHRAERVPFIEVHSPSVRLSPVRGAEESSARQGAQP